MAIQRPPKTYTESEVVELDALLTEYRDLAAQQDALTTRENAIRSRLLEMLEPMLTDDDASPLPGVQIATRVTFEYDPEAVLDWAFQDTGTLMQAAAVLKTNADLTPLIVGMAVNDPSLRRVLTVDSGAYQKALASGRLVDAPHADTPQIARSVRITTRNVKVGADLRAEIDVIPDDVLADEDSGEDAA